jgi:hypothetical protein
VTFKELKKKVVSETAVQQSRSRQFERLQNKPFWIWNIAEHKQEDIKTNGDKGSNGGSSGGRRGNPGICGNSGIGPNPGGCCCCRCCICEIVFGLACKFTVRSIIFHFCLL